MRAHRLRAQTNAVENMVTCGADDGFVAVSVTVGGRRVCSMVTLDLKSTAWS